MLNVLVHTSANKNDLAVSGVFVGGKRHNYEKNLSLEKSSIVGAKFLACGLRVMAPKIVGQYLRISVR